MDSPPGNPIPRGVFLKKALSPVSLCYGGPGISVYGEGIKRNGEEMGKNPGI